MTLFVYRKKKIFFSNCYLYEITERRIRNCCDKRDSGRYIFSVLLVLFVTNLLDEIKLKKKTKNTLSNHYIVYLMCLKPDRDIPKTDLFTGICVNCKSSSVISANFDLLS